MFVVSKDSPAFYLTSVAKDRLPVFQTSTIAEIACKAIDEARKSGGFLIFAYVLMPDHGHLVTDSRRKSSDIHRFVNGIISRRIIDHLKANGPEESLAKLRIQERAGGYK
jgi:REP element-mobilizing transposase RayT